MSVIAPLNGLEPPAFRLSAERASQLRHRGLGAYLALYICVLSENNSFLTDFGGGKFIYSPRIFLSFHIVVVITSASHAEDLQCDPGWKYMITFRKILSFN